MTVSNLTTTYFVSEGNNKRAASLIITFCLTFCILCDPAVGSALDHMHTLSPSYHATVIESDASETYVFQAPGISYNGVLGRTFGCRIRLAAFFPVHLFQEGHYIHARDYYSTALGGEALLGGAYTFHLLDDQTVTLDVGPSINAMKLGSEEYQSFYSLTFGFGAGIEYTYPLNRILVLGTFITAAGHFLDMIHETNGLKVGVFISAGITLGLAFEGSTHSR